MRALMLSALRTHRQLPIGADVRLGTRLCRRRTADNVQPGVSPPPAVRAPAPDVPEVGHVLFVFVLLLDTARRP